MKKIFGLMVVMMMFGFAWGVEAPAQGRVVNTRIVQATKDTTLTYAGVKVFVPAGQTVILAQNLDGSVVVRGQNMQGVKIGEGTVSAQGPVVLSVQPKTQVITVHQGAAVRIADGNGRTAVLSQGASVSARDIRASASQTAQAAAAVAVVSPQEQLPSFVAGTQTSQTASEQAIQDVEDTTSPSAPSRSR